MDDAAKIINDAARRPRVEVKGSQRHQARDPFRTIELVELEVPRCTFACPKKHRCYPEGAVLYVLPRQVQAHMQLYPGARILRHVRRTFARRLHGSGMVPDGHRDVSEFLSGKKVER